MNTQPKAYYTPERYLELEREARYKSEYYQGEIFAMAGGSPNHNSIKENVSATINVFLRGKGCRSYSSDQRIHVYQNTLYTYPDIVAICGPNQYTDLKRDTITNPTLIVEILSPGTAAYDRGEKFALYRQIPTLQEYVVIDSQLIRAEVFRKNEYGFWFIASEASQPDQHIRLESIGLAINMTDAYAETEGILPLLE